jgi:uncharacterized membrane protein YhaH (DUF805 family)
MDFNWYLDPIKNHYFDFEGVADRKTFWMFVLYNVLITLALDVVLSVVHLGPLASLYSLAVLLPSLGLAARRLHDIGMSAWWLLVGLVPVIGWIVLIYFYCQPSKSPYATSPA